MCQEYQVMCKAFLSFFVVVLGAVVIGCSDDDTSNFPAPLPIPDILPIAEARNVPLGTAVHVQGFVSMAPGTRFSSTGEVGFGMQDDTGGIYVSVASLVDLPQNAGVEVVGDIIDVSSELVLFSNFTGVKRLEGDKAVVPEVVKTADIGEPLEGRLVRIIGTVSKAVVQEKPSGVKAFVDDGSGEAQIYVNLVNDTPLIDTAKLVPGTSVQITGFVNQFESTYEIAPRRGTDLVLK
jgi:DNA/RNA endonuclease YhcR with UshA esterase domain